MSRGLQRAQALHFANPPVLTVVEELAAALRLAGIADPRRVATDILAALLEVPRSWPVMHRDLGLAPEIVASARLAAQRMARGAPFAYAVGCVQFRELTLEVDERVLIPRPETEVLVSAVLERMRSRHGGAGGWGTAVDVGTGSGAIALSLALEGSFDRVIGTDISVDALAVAARNRDRPGRTFAAPIELRRGSLLAPVAGVRASVVVSNPPYVAFSEIEALPRSVRDWEPCLALLSGHDGMSATARIIRAAAAILDYGGMLALEVDERRASLVAELMMGQGCYTDVSVGLDLTGRERIVLASRI